MRERAGDLGGVAAASDPEGQLGHVDALLVRVQLRGPVGALDVAHAIGRLVDAAHEGQPIGRIGVGLDVAGAEALLAHDLALDGGDAGLLHLLGHIEARDLLGEGHPDRQHLADLGDHDVRHLAPGELDDPAGAVTAALQGRVLVEVGAPADGLDEALAVDRHLGPHGMAPLQLDLLARAVAVLAVLDAALAAVLARCLGLGACEVDGRDEGQAVVHDDGVDVPAEEVGAHLLRVQQRELQLAVGELGSDRGAECLQVLDGLRGCRLDGALLAHRFLPFAPLPSSAMSPSVPSP